jgi:hypothetical protein
MKVHNLELFHETNKNTSKFRQRSSAKAKPYRQKSNKKKHYCLLCYPIPLPLLIVYGRATWAFVPVNVDYCFLIRKSFYFRFSMNEIIQSSV